MRILLLAKEFEDARGLEEWSYNAEQYPDHPLIADELTKYDNADIPVRAHYLLAAMRSLLELLNAPPAMIADLSLLLTSFAPKGAKKYADAHRALIENPSVGVTEISKISGLDRSTIHALLKKGVLVRPE